MFTLLLYSKNETKLLDKDTWYTIENLFFQTGKSDFKENGADALDNLAEILLANPTMKVKLGGYTDNTGNESTNQKLSTLRAETAKLKLMELGINGDRIEAEGYGSQFPVCAENDTDECKAMNRRIDVRVISL